jgi:hypothetical protein
MARPCKDESFKVPRGCSSLIEQLIEHETLRINNSMNKGIGKVSNRTGLFDLFVRSDRSESLLVKKRDFVKVRENRNFAWFKAL